MVVINLSTKQKQASNFINSLAKDYPKYTFRQGNQDHWSPARQTIIYNPSKPLVELQYSVLHELAHAELGHKSYSSDIELVKLEAEAWQLAAALGKKYKIDISNDHIQNCLDTYRDWLHRRSACPTCGLRTVQTDHQHYECFNCRTKWAVSGDRFSRAYRKTKGL